MTFVWVTLYPTLRVEDEPEDELIETASLILVEIKRSVKKRCL